MSTKPNCGMPPIIRGVLVRQKTYDTAHLNRGVNGFSNSVWFSVGDVIARELTQPADYAMVICKFGASEAASGAIKPLRFLFWLISKKKMPQRRNANGI
jgi:hypothetical protein